MLQTRIQNERSIVFSNGAKVEIYVETPYARWVDIGAITGAVNFGLNFEIFRGEVDTFQNNDSIMVNTGATLTFTTIELRPEVFHELAGQGLGYTKSVTNGAALQDFATAVLTKNQFRLTALDDYSNTRQLTIYNAAINSFNGLNWNGNTGANSYQFSFDCLYDSSDRLYLYSDKAGYDYQYVFLLGRPDAGQTVLGRPDAGQTVLGRAYTDTLTGGTL